MDSSDGTQAGPGQVDLQEAEPPHSSLHPRRTPRDLTNGSIPKNLFHLAWPQSLEGILNVFDQVWDLFLAGQGFGFRGIAGIGVAQQYVQLFRTSRMGVDVAMRAMIARAIGAGDIRLANHVAFQGFTVSMIFSVGITIFGLIFTDVLLRAVGISHELVAEAANYMRWQFVASAMNGIRVMTGSSLQAAGDTLTPMKATMVARLIDLVLSPVLMFGWAGPEFGLAGAAVANAISQSVSSTMNIRSLAIGSSRLHMRLSEYRFDLKLILRLIRLASPASINSVERAASQMLLVVMMAPFGDIPLAAYALTQRMQTVVNVGTQGIGNASGIIAGQSLGAGKVERAKETVLWALGYTTVVKFFVVSLLFIFPTPFLSIFSDDPELLEVGARWLRILLDGYLAMGLVQVLQQSFQIAGDTFMPMVVTLTAMWFVEVPGAMALSGAAEQMHPLGLTLRVPTIGTLGHYGVAWAVTGAAFFRLACYLPYFVWGPWWRKKVLEGVDLVPW